MIRNIKLAQTIKPLHAGGGGKGDSGGGGPTQSQTQAQTQNQEFGQNVWDPQATRLNQVYGMGNRAAKSATQGINDLTPSVAQNMQNIYGATQPAWQNQMQGGVYQGMDLQGMYGNAMQGGGNEQFVNEQVMGGAGNDYADAMRGQIMRDSEGVINQNLGALDARAAASGMSGGSRHGTAQGNMIQNVNQNAQNQLSQIGYESFDKNLDRMSRIGRNADQFDMQRIGNISNMMGQQQNAMNQGINNAGQMQGVAQGQFAPYMAGFQPANAYANIVGGPQVLNSGSSNSQMDMNTQMTGAEQQSGGGKGIMGTIGGIAGGIGGSMIGMPSLGATAGSAIGNQIG